MTTFLVTGGAGFIGSHLVDALLAQGHRVCALDDLSTGRVENLTEAVSHPSFTFVEGSVLDSEVVDRVVSSSDVVLHLAAAVGVALIVEQPLESLTTNIRGSEIVLEASFRHGKKVLVTSTSEIYGKNTSDALSEDDDRVLGSPLKARWSYSEAKAIEEVLAHAYWRGRGLPTVILRLFNTVGPRQVGTYGMVIPRLVHQALEGRPMTVYGTGEQTRCFCHVSDVVRAIIGAVDAPEAVGQVFNVGSQEEVSIFALAELVRQVTDSSSQIVLVPYETAYESGFEDMQRRRPDTRRIHGLIGWTPQYSLTDIIADVADHMRRPETS